MWSDDMRFAHYNTMAAEIKKETEAGADGIIVSHGTDTLGYTAAALAFILCDIPIPVILVGAQRSSDRGSSDAAVNMICAAEFIAQTDFAGVAVCMHENMSDDTCVILPACKTRKMHTSRRDAFKPINAMPIARVDFHTKDIEFLQSGYKKKTDLRNIEIMPIKEDIKVGVLKIHTNMYPEEFGCYRKFDGLVIEGTGLGHTPAHATDKATKIHEEILREIKALVDAGVTVAMAPQAIFGRVNMNVYSKGRDLQKAGVLGDGTDMIPETAFIKLAWLLSNYDAPNVKKLYAVNLRGEISERSGDEFLE
jgi:glutamyl-tRNA(Gln) amidotransferase subunit D